MYRRNQCDRKPNPPEYNGYKVYWEDGAQITPPHDTGIMDEVKKVTDYAAVKTMPLDEAKAAGLYQVIGADIDDPNIAELKKLVLHPGLMQGSGLHRLFCRGQVQVQMPLLLPGSGSLRSGSLHPAAPAPEQRIHF